MNKPVLIGPFQPLRAELSVPADKSISHRVALASLLSQSPVTVTNYLTAEDTLATLDAIKAFDARVAPTRNSVRITGVGLHCAPEPKNVIDARNSGTLARIILGIAAGFGRFSCFTGDASLRERPMGRVVEPLRRMGAEIRGVTGGERLPMVVLGNGGGLRSSETVLPVASAQVKSCLLFAGLFADGPVMVTEPGRSRDHTERLLKACGVEVTIEDAYSSSRLVTIEPPGVLQIPGEIEVPGDFSSAAFWITAALVVPGSEVRIRKVGLNPTRTRFLDILSRMGAEVEMRSVVEDVIGEPVGELVVRHSHLRATEIGPDDVPSAVDELPLLALLGAFAEGETLVWGARELRVKETDRIKSVCEEFRQLGVDIEERPDGFAVLGDPKGGIRGGRASSRGDHRIGMGLAIAGLASEGGVEVENLEAAAVSYPRFLWDLERISGRSDRR
ncbi:MAG: 3-phosphoshikimate 1-carboxyvinyltransferase [Rubrobacter sp.]|nr:3-phosphoshikimate 1-carboxyvinyltransferase [Rubrobacter sp.]